VVFFKAERRHLEEQIQGLGKVVGREDSGVHVWQWWMGTAWCCWRTDAELRGVAELGSGCCGVVLCLRFGGGRLFLPPCALPRSFSLCFSSLWLSLSPLPPRALPGCGFASAWLQPALPRWATRWRLVRLDS